MNCSLFIQGEIFYVFFISPTSYCIETLNA
nr:MAG TPA: hypothetical protein [Caudoviricetes sp.]